MNVHSPIHMLALVLALTGVWILSRRRYTGRLRPIVLQSIMKGASDHDRYVSVMCRISSLWPALVTYLPVDASPFIKGVFLGDGICTHPDYVRWPYLRPRGGSFYMMHNRDRLPDAFSWIGLYHYRSTESLFVLFFRNGRLFWFEDPYVVERPRLLRPRDKKLTPTSVKETAGALGAALDRWSHSTDDVIYSGYLGWFDSQKGFERPINEFFFEEYLADDRPVP